MFDLSIPCVEVWHISHSTFLFLAHSFIFLVTIITPSLLRSPINYFSWGVLLVAAKALNQGTKCVFYLFLQLT